ncbi:MULTISPECIES: nucleotidyltransferase family protein [Rhodophyticola]|uniref:nucleotidyltransferase family protein n=1 Tax=Rhodophyticola TaxID=2680018 RepID=UPI001B01B912|nr:nucleotidyltransferase family protein [Roseicyclus sp.]MBO6625138.1 nucleotidyltransferase family protein [Roseicyclus sp.]MBO6923081.1 nucleotidyltransferase family protein [Roseicyclus sp.]
MTPRSCMILAAGFGRRMGALTADRPKPLIEVAGRPMIEHALAQARDAGAAPIAVNGHYRADRLAAYLTEQEDVTFLHETPEVLDSGGGVRNALPVLGEGPIWCLNSDAVWRGENALRLLAAGWRPGAMDGLLLLVPRDRAVGRQGGGDFALSETGRITPDKTGLVWTGAQILDGAVFDDTAPGPFSMWVIWRKLMARGRLFGAIYPGFWADVGHPGGIPLAEAMLERRDAV